MTRRKVRRRKVWINGHFVDNPKTEGYRKFLEATLPHQDPQLKGFDSVELKDWLDIVEGRKSNIEDDD
jgi:hypothetical protein